MEAFAKEFDETYGIYLKKLLWMSGNCSIDDKIMEYEQDLVIGRCNTIYRKYLEIGVDAKEMEEYMHAKGLF